MWLIQRSNNTFASEKFSTDGEGDTKPVVPNTTAAGRKQNRRVEITLVE
jgi:outer membrane protein OmpA-like peptidoglycan-associated protein